MREIKFRAWNKKSKKMYYGNSNEWAEWFEAKDNPIGIINRILNGNYTEEEYIFMQYTGLKDRDGKEIYEGDIVKTRRGVGIVRFGDTYLTINGEYSIYYYGFYIEYGKYILSSDEDMVQPLLSSGCEVIGNIYENPELLRGEKQ